MTVEPWSVFHNKNILFWLVFQIKNWNNDTWKNKTKVVIKKNIETDQKIKFKQKKKVNLISF